MEIVILAGTFGAFWLLFIRPQQRRLREHQRFVASLQVGDEVITSSGLYGVLRRVDDDSVQLEIAPGLEVRMARGAIARATVADGPADDGAGEVAPWPGDDDGSDAEDGDA